MDERCDESDDSRGGLPLRGARRAPRRAILASHLIFTGYAHWLPNDPRGSGSIDVRKNALKELGAILPGRQFPQPPRQQVKQFHKDAEARLDHERLWFKESHREIIAEAFANTANEHRYTLWACAILSNHAHIVVRTHRDSSDVIWANLAHASAAALHLTKLVPPNHAVWSHRPYKVFLRNRDDILGRIRYVEENPLKERLPRQQWTFVQRFV